MNVEPCPSCVAEGVDCPLVIDGECIHCDGPGASGTDRETAAMRWWTDTGPLDPLTSFRLPGRRF